MKTLTTKFYLLLTLIFITSSSFATDNFMAPPVNDLIENAIDLDEGPFPYSELAVNFPEATLLNDPTPNTGNCTISIAGIWYKFTATKTALVAGLIVSPNGGYVVFFSAPHENVTNGMELTFVDEPSNSCAIGNSSTIEAVAGTTYYIYMKNEVVSDVLININAALVPEHDLLENAKDLNSINETNFIDQDIQFQFATNTNDGGQIDCDTQALEGVWYKLYSNFGGIVTGQMGFDPTDSAIAIYRAANGDVTDGSELTFVDYVANTCGFNTYTEIDAEPSTYYYIFAYSQHPMNTILFTLDSDILDMSENKLEGFSFYPNPISSEINLIAKAPIDEVNIFNLIGQQVLSETPFSTRKVMDLSFLPTGLYVMQVTSEGISESFKIVKN
jgi:hypothetical protein